MPYNPTGEISAFKVRSLPMTISLSSEAQQLIEERLKSGRYATAEDVVLAALATLRQQEAHEDYAPGELAALVAEGEESIRTEGTVDADEVFEGLRRLSAERRAKG